MNRSVCNARVLALLLSCLGLFLSGPATAGDFDASGNFTPSGEAVAFVDFSSFDPAKDLYFSESAPSECLNVASFALVEEPDALSGAQVGALKTQVLEGCVERITVKLPEEKGSYRASVWARSSTVAARFIAIYPEDSGLEVMAARLSPTGRVTSDGWVELASNNFPVDGAVATATYLHVYNFDSRGAQIDAIEVIKSGQFEEQKSCGGIADPVCGAGSVCIHQRCQMGRLSVPIVPDVAIRTTVLDVLQSHLRVHFGGRKTRLLDMPEALSLIEKMRYEQDPWVFWNLYGQAIRALSDAHTSLNGPINQVARRRRLNLCFIAGEADRSQGSWPSHAQYPDILVSHVGSEATQGHKPGDRLVAVDGVHPVAWARKLRAIDWGYYRANDDTVFNEFIERLRGLVTAYATTYTFIACDTQTGSCEGIAQTVKVKDLPLDDGGQVRCDNRPTYHYEGNANPKANHSVGGQFFKGRIAGLPQGEEVYGLLWDTLYGGGDPNGFVNKNLSDSFALFKAKARGVVLDHRSGNGGTLDAAETATWLVKPPTPVLVFLSPANFAGDMGPENEAAGVQLFKQNILSSSMLAGSNSWDPDMPVALLTHRDVSASDFFPFAFKGAKKGRIFGPGPTAGAFSTFYNLSFWGPLSLQLATGDAISSEGKTLIGYGVAPDVVVQQKQSDLMVGKDTIFETALSWVRANLKAAP
jgi:hypothetical protein